MRKLNRTIRRENLKEIESKRIKNKMKIEHLKNALNKEIQSAQYKQPFEQGAVPRILSDYADLSIFAGPEALPQKQESVGPFLCHKDIKLGISERRLLCKDPKYSLVTIPSDQDYIMEYEKALSKHRFGQHSLNKKKRGKKYRESMWSKEQFKAF